MSKKFDRWGTVDALTSLYGNVILLKSLKNKVKVPVIFALVYIGNKDIISIQEHQIDTTMHLVHEPLEYLGCIPQSKKRKGILLGKVEL